MWYCTYNIHYFLVSLVFYSNFWVFAMIRSFISWCWTRLLFPPRFSRNRPSQLVPPYLTLLTFVPEEIQCYANIYTCIDANPATINAIELNRVGSRRIQAIVN
mmetsp:Transcript_28015/g.58698  ORF Transcript_28015/g.58698 Transcript_28015/m.58698 type:complete len:103 (-) Transcript_28015:1390-1698(-)